MPPNLSHSTFQLGLLQDTSEEFYSSPLQLTDQEWHFQSLMPTLEGMVPLEGVCHNQILFQSGTGWHVCYFTIKTKNENGMRIMNILPTFLLANKTSKPLNVAPMSLQATGNHFEMVKPDFLQSQKYEVNESSPLLHWQILDSRSSKDKSLFQGIQHLSLKATDSTWSSLVPLPLYQDSCQDSKMSFSLPLENPQPYANRLQLMTMHHRGGQTYLVIQSDGQPQFSIHNDLPLTVYFSNTADKKRRILPDPQGEIVQVHQSSSVLVAASKCSFKSLVKAESNNGNVTIFLTSVQPKNVQGKRFDQDWELISADKQIKDWSAALDVAADNAVTETCCNIPGYGESSIRLERANGMVSLFIRPFSDNEISAKDIRSRIKADKSRSSTPDELCPDLSSASEFSHTSEPDFATEENSFYSTIQSPQSNISARTHYRSALLDPDRSS